MGISQEKLFAVALNEIRELLSGYLGSNLKEPMEVREAAHLAYALHNEAQASIDGEEININDALKKIEEIDKILGENFGGELSSKIRDNA